MLQAFLSLWPWLSDQKSRTVPQGPHQTSASQMPGELQELLSEVWARRPELTPQADGGRACWGTEDGMAGRSPKNSLCKLGSASCLWAFISSSMRWGKREVPPASQVGRGCQVVKRRELGCTVAGVEA